MGSRREFVRNAIVAAAALPVIGCTSEATHDQEGQPAQHDPNSSMTENSTPPSLAGLQLYTVRALMEADTLGTLETVAEIGYREVEFAGYFGHDPSAIRTHLDQLGVQSPAAHFSLADFSNDIERVIETAAVVGHRYLVCAWIPEEQRTSLDDYRRLARSFNEWGMRCSKAGIQFAYHNHDFEFAAHEGGIPYDILLNECDAGLVAMEIDLYWIRKAGHDPFSYFERYPGRFKLCHVKDMAENGDMADVGAGTIDFAAVFEHAELAGIEHYFAEHDNPTDAIQSITTSYSGLANLLKG